MTNEELKEKIISLLGNSYDEWISIQETTIDIWNFKNNIPREKLFISFDKIADTLIAAGLIFKKDYRKSRRAELARQERFAKEQGFTPDCSPYYIALQYKKRAESIRKETAQEIFSWFWHNLVNLNFITGNIEVNFAALQNFARTYGIELIEKIE